MDSIDQQIENAAKNYQDRPTKESYTFLCAFVNIKMKLNGQMESIAMSLIPFHRK